MKTAPLSYRQSKNHVTSGTHRSRSPAETMDAYSRFMGTLGITRLANITGLDRVGIPVYLGIRPNSRSVATSQGKGIDKDHARTSALMESIENWHAEHIELPARLESFWKLSEKHAVADIFEIPLRAGATLRPDVPAVWVEGYDLLNDRMIWVPYECATMNTVITFSLTLTFYTSSNGLASGNHILEAINHALFEMIERDSHAEWLDRPVEQRLATKVDPETVTDAECRLILERFQAAGLDVAIWDMTSDRLGIPVYSVQILDRDEALAWRRIGVGPGRGCHLSPAVALSRALCEAAQARLTIISGSRDDNLLIGYRESGSELHHAVWKSQYFDPPAIAAFNAQSDHATDSFEGDLQRILQALRSRGVTQAAVVNLTRPDIGIPVVKAVVPKLGLATEYGGRAPAPASRNWKGRR